MAAVDRCGSRRRPGAAGEFSGILKTIPLDVAGKTVVLRGFLRTKDVNGSVALWLREDGDRPNLAFDTTQKRQVSGTHDWQEHRVSVPIEPEGRQLYFGVLVAGSGTVWADDLELLVDDKPRSPRRPGPCGRRRCSTRTRSSIADRPSRWIACRRCRSRTSRRSVACGASSNTITPSSRPAGGTGTTSSFASCRPCSRRRIARRRTPCS